MDLKLTRYGSTPMGTPGELTAGGIVLSTMERQWLNNTPFKSCIPAGTYRLEPHDSSKHPDCWALVNEDLGVYHYSDPNASRYAILIHIANKPSQLAGCIAPGEHFGCLGAEWAVMASGMAMDDLREVLAEDEKREDFDGHTLTIEWANYEG